MIVMLMSMVFIYLLKKTLSFMKSSHPLGSSAACVFFVVETISGIACMTDAALSWELMLLLLFFFFYLVLENTSCSL